MRWCVYTLSCAPGRAGSAGRVARVLCVRGECKQWMLSRVLATRRGGRGQCNVQRSDNESMTSCTVPSHVVHAAAVQCCPVL